MRFIISELSVGRVSAAVTRRIRDVPDWLAWHNPWRNPGNEKYLDGFRNRHEGLRCVVIANGPSTRKMDLEVLSCAQTMTMNRAYLMFETWGFIPSYHVCINELVLEQYGKEISELNVPAFVNHNRRRLIGDEELQNNIGFLRFGMGFGLRDRFRGDVTRSISSGGTVTYACLQLAYFMGFSEVVLIGLDHHYAEKGVPNQTEVRRSQEDVDHCHPDYFPKGTKWQNPDLYRSEQAYRLARHAFEADGRRIYDATINGKCTIFEKIGFEDLEWDGRRAV